MSAAPLQLVDTFLLNYNVGDALVIAFVLGLLAMIPLRSWKVVTLHVITFGLLFFLLPSGMLAVDPDGAHILGSTLQYKLLGLGLLFVGPVIFATADD